MDQTNPISNVLELAAKGPCILCQKPAAMAGSFTPDDGEKFGAEPGKHRTIFYGLCVACAQNCDFQAVEEILLYSINIKDITHH